jgi:hypothetical protein
MIGYILVGASIMLFGILIGAALMMAKEKS